MLWTDKQLKMATGLITDGNHGRPGPHDGRGEEDGIHNTENPHYWATELNLPDSTVKGFLRCLRARDVLVTRPHPRGGRCIDPDTRALILDRGPAWDSFVEEYHAIEDKEARMNRARKRVLDSPTAVWG